VYATSSYNGALDSFNQSKVYLLNVQFWPPYSKNATNPIGGGTLRGTTDPVDTNNFHIQCLGSMEEYMANNPPITTSSNMISIANLKAAATTIDTSTTAGLIETRGSPEYI
jgi:hypothetical protein